MEVTDVRIFLTGEEKLKAFVSVVFDNCFVVSDIKIIQGQNGRFLSMPSKKRKDGTFKDIAHPLNNETRKWLEEIIFARYDELLRTAGRSPLQAAEGGGDSEGDSEGEKGQRISELDGRKFLP